MQDASNQEYEWFGVNDRLHYDERDGLIREYEQEFPADYWSGLQWAREQDRVSRCPDMWRVASVPAVFVEKMMREGLNIWEAPLKDIVGWLKRHSLDDFLTTEKRIV